MEFVSATRRTRFSMRLLYVMGTTRNLGSQKFLVNCWLELIFSFSQYGDPNSRPLHFLIDVPVSQLIVYWYKDGFFSLDSLVIEALECSISSRKCISDLVIAIPLVKTNVLQHLCP